MQTISVEVTWESLHDIEVPDSYKPGDDIPIIWLAGVKSHTASLVDWKAE